MRQGKATSSTMGSTKVEPVSKAVPPAYAAGIGVKQGNHAMDKGTVRVKHIPMYEGRGLSAPMAACTIHKKGSQRG